MAKYPDRRFATRYERELGVVVDREKARFSAWYEMFPRSCSQGGTHGTFRDCEARLPYIASWGLTYCICLLSTRSASHIGRVRIMCRPRGRMIQEVHGESVHRTEGMRQSIHN